MEKNKKTDILKIIYFIRLNWKYLISIPRSIYLNFRLLPLNQAIKVPIFFSNYTRVRICRNSRLIINSHEIHAGMIKIGYTHCDFFWLEIINLIFILKRVLFCSTAMLILVQVAVFL